MKKQHFFSLGIIFLFYHLLYFNTIGAGFVKDFTGLMERLEGAVFADFLNCFGYPGLHQVTNFFLFLIVDFLGQNPLAWYLIFTSLHFCNAFLFFKIGEKTLALFQIKKSHQISFCAALLFSFYPYQNEAVVWRVCFNYLMVTLLILSSLWFFLKFLKTQNNRNVFWSFFFYFLAIFTFELALITPFLMSLIFIFYWNFQQKPTTLFAPFFKKVFLPKFALLALYFPINKLMVGTWIGHYGADQHLNISPTLLLGNFYKYFLKNLTFLRDLPHTEKQHAIQVLENDWNIGFTTFLVILIFILAILFFKKLHPKLKLAGMFLMAFFIALLPIMNLYFGWILHTEGDRYGYFAAGFFFLFLMMLISFLPKYLKWFLFLTYLIFSIFFLYRTNQFWQKGTEIYFSLLKNYQWENEKQVYILACPDNFEGTYLFKDYSKKSLAVKHALIYNLGEKVAGNIQQVAQFNMTKMTDNVSAKVDMKNRITVKFNQWGNWWWRNGIGASDYETADYRFWRISNGYRIQFKSEELPKDAVFIYADGKDWKTLDIERSTLDE